MFVNLHTLPAGHSLFTLYVTVDPEGTPRSKMSAEEIDVVAPRHCSSWGQINVNENHVLNDEQGAMEYMLEVYGPDVRVIGVVNESDGYVVWDAFKDGTETGADDL